MTRAARIAKSLTSAQARALTGAFEASDVRTFGPGTYFPRLSVRMDVRARLQALGLLSRRPGHGLTKLGVQVRTILRGEAQ